MTSKLLVEVLKRISRALDNNKIVGAGVVGIAVLLWARNKYTKEKNNVSSRLNTGKNDKKKIDKQFWDRFVFILHTAMPSLLCRETATASLLTITLIIRTLASLIMSRILGNFVKVFCNRNWKEVWRVIVIFTLFCIPVSVLNASLKFYTQALSSNLREKITKRVHELYMEDRNFYWANKVGELKLQHADQLIAEDIAKFSSQLSSVYSNALKPLVDFILFSLQMRQSLGNKGPLTMYFWFTFAAWISSIVMPAYWRLQIRSQELEGHFRSRHKRLIESSEMIAFNGGEIPEKMIIDKSFADINKHSARSNSLQLLSNVLMGYLNKYAASSVGMTLVCLPIFLSKKYADLSAADIASFYIQCTRIMGGQAEAVLALFDLQKEIGQLVGLTYRVWSLMYRLEYPEELTLPTEPDNPPTYVDSNTLRFKNVSIYKPDGTLLVKHLNFEVPTGTRVMITGENGCGKSSLFRVLRGLWPLSVGTIESPPRHSLKTFYFLSQANFVPIGSLREILIYPQLVEEIRAEGKTDDDLWEVLKWTKTNLKVGEVIPTLDTVLDWGSVLSPGVKQRLAFARLLFHQPKYAILDECTNNISPKVEIRLYNKCKELGITVFSISHKSELKKFHDYELRYDGVGGYKWIDLSIGRIIT